MGMEPDHPPRVINEIELNQREFKPFKLPDVTLLML